ncbi:hypothetical protein F0562_017712 [Nyssa sinensis]|uniref:Uncharacterized protein n=1 Tax=Nyssa sinensis TaxID=561372 RepID=A0A5J4ZH88_9ASTE|nr:hypothetical protein F0562_017712 [Nyssa sinensis]
MTAAMVMSPGMEFGSSNNGNFRDAWVELKWRCEVESKRDGNAAERERQQQRCGSSGAAALAFQFDGLVHVDVRFEIADFYT